jgi:uncharacterized OsmC-like protein/alpha/beta superfamily hydrolase
MADKVEFPGSLGAPLAARLDLPAGPPRAYALFAHCFTCTKDTRASAHIAAALAERGIATLRFDFTGLGGSGGDFANSHFSSNVDDLVAAADFLRSQGHAPELLVGHSLGGTAVLMAAHRIPEAAAVATLGSPFEPSHVLRHIRDKGAGEVDIGGRAFRISPDFVEDLKKQRPGDTVARLGKALMVMHSPRDTIVDIDNASQIFMAAKHPKSFVSLDPADHLLSRAGDARYAGSVLAAWAERHLAAAPEAPRGAEGRVIVRETGEGKFAQHVVSGRHVLRADEPAAVGGLDSGPAPYDYLLAALGACTSMTIRMYADLKKLPLERVTVDLRHAKIHAQDCAECETREGKVDRIERSIRLDGALDAAQRAKLMEIADKCPVHRTLHGEVSVVSRMEGE